MVENEDLVLRDDGLLYCKKCGTPRQCRVPGFGSIPEQIQYCLCKCKAQEAYADYAALKSDMSRMEIERARQMARPDPSFREHTFENDDGNHAELMRKARKYAGDFKQHLQKCSGLIMYGPRGTGKSYAAEAIANKVIDMGYAVLVTTFGKIAESVTAAGFEERGDYYQSLMKYPLLIIDDVGMERETEYMMEIMQRVIDDRDRSKRPMIITTNFTAAEINKPRNEDWGRIWSRVMRTCYPIKCEGNDQRAEIGINHIRQMKKYYEE